ncbi:MAG: hypothetical protein ACOX3D_09440 [Syntrophomonadales bacterium]
MAEIKYRVGTLPLVSITPGQEDLMSARVEAEKARAELENLRADLAKLKADFYYVTGRNVYESADWSTGSGSAVDLGTINYKAPDRQADQLYRGGAHLYEWRGRHHPGYPGVY